MTPLTSSPRRFVHRANVLRRAHLLAKTVYSEGDYSARLALGLKQVWAEVHAAWEEERKGWEAEQRAEARRLAKAENRFAPRPAKRDDRPVATERMSEMAFDSDYYGFSASRRQDCHAYADFAWSGSR